MAQLWRAWGVVVLGTLVLVPAAALGVWALAGARLRRGVPAGEAWRRSAAQTVAVAGTLPWLFMALTPRDAQRAVQLVPLRDLAAVLTGDAGFAAGQIGGNLLFFAAFGFAAPVRWPALASLPRVFLLGVAGSAAVEAAQFLFDIGRVSSIDDVLLNALGAALGAAAARRWWAARPARSTPTGDAAGRSAPVP